MIQEKLKTIRKQRGISQEKMAKIISTDPSNYSRKERGEIRIHDEEWQKIANALDVPIEEIRDEKAPGIVHNDNSTLHDQSGSYIHNYNVPTSILENLQDYIALLKKEIEDLKEEIKAQDK